MKPTLVQTETDAWNASYSVESVVLKGLYFQKLGELKYKLTYGKQPIVPVKSAIKCENGQFVLSEDDDQDILQCVVMCHFVCRINRRITAQAKIFWSSFFCFAHYMEFHLALFEDYYSCVYE